MKITSIKIKNFKSFGEENNRMDLGEITTIVGKNESGKSNFLNAISKLNFDGFSNLNDEDKNKNYINDEIVISMIAFPYEKEKEIYLSEKETKFTIKGNGAVEFEGGLSEIISKNNNIQFYKNELINLSKGITFSEPSHNITMNKMIENIKNIENKVFVYSVMMDTMIKNLSRNSKYSEFLKTFEEFIKRIKTIYSLLPRFIFLKNVELESKYTKNSVLDNGKHDDVLTSFLKVIGVEKDEVKRFWILSCDGDKYNFQEEINKKIQKFMEGFNQFYKQDNVELRMNFNNEYINFLVKTNKKYLNLSERSNGLKWYLSFYIQLLAQTQKTNLENFVVLLDEPGVFLHVNAQKMILELFENFVSKNNQIIYTTQHPSMIYQEHLDRVRTIIKDENENSNISNAYHSLPHSMAGKQETITPILEAIGMKMGYSFSAMSTEKNNIITEGISDFNYLKAYFIQKGIEDTCNIIPSSGVSNIHNLVSILMGWGYKYKVLLDQDRDGRNEYKVLVKKLLVQENDIIFVDAERLPKEEQSITIESLFSDRDRNEIGINNKDYEGEKKYYSLAVLKKIEKKEFLYDEETIKKFDILIGKLL
ncbi:MAG: AAA family ATPase [Clostridia bacterium]|nr:AAA family ATPase [Clostridia bacterium]